MNSSTGRSSMERSPLTFVLIFGAMIFGMVLAGGMDLTPVSSAAPDSPEKAVHVTPSAVGGLPSFADLAEAVSPAVVSIQATTIEEGSRMSLRDLFNPRRERQEGDEQQRSDASGSGFVISADGLIVTNHHVIERATELTVLLEGRQYPAEIKGDDPATDIALIKIEPDEPLDYLELGDSDALRVGDWIMVIGSPLRLQNSVSVGVVSAKGRSINITPDASLESFIQTDAAINFGNSGGPLVDLEGRVIGIATAINYGAENIGFAVPVATLERILPQLRDTGAVKRGYLGVNIQDLDTDSAAAFGFDSTDGVLVTRVTEGGPAESAGLEHGDIILQVDGVRMNTNRQLIDYISAKMPGESVQVELFRGGKTLKKSVKLEERPLNGAVPVTTEEEPEQSDIEWLGLQYQSLSDGLRSNHNLPEDLGGIFITNVAPTSPLFEDGVRQGDVITEVNGQAVGDVGTFESTVEGVGSGSYLRLYVRRYDPRTGDMAASFFAIVRVP